MTPTDVIEISTAILASLGGGAAIVLAFSGWLGKVWADRLMAQEKAAHDERLEALRIKLENQSEAALSELRAHLDIAKSKHLSGHDDKIKIYRLVTDVVSDVLGHFDQHQLQGLPPDKVVEAFNRFNRGRMRAYGYLAMLAPQQVMDAADALFDDLMLIMNGGRTYDWPRVRGHILRLLNAVRTDIGFDPSPIEYRGVL